LTRAQTNCDLHVAILHKLQKQGNTRDTAQRQRQRQLWHAPRTLATCRKRATFLSISLICLLMWGRGRGRRKAAPYQQQKQQQLTAVSFTRFVVVLFSFYLFYFFVFVCVGGMQKSLKLILIFDLCQTNLRARHQTAQIRQIILISTLSVALTQIPNHKKSFAKYFANEIRKSIILKHKTAKRKGDNEQTQKWSGVEREREMESSFAWDISQTQLTETTTGQIEK